MKYDLLSISNSDLYSANDLIKCHQNILLYFPRLFFFLKSLIVSFRERTAKCKCLSKFIVSTNDKQTWRSYRSPTNLQILLSISNTDIVCIQVKFVMIFGCKRLYVFHFKIWFFKKRALLESIIYIIYLGILMNAIYYILVQWWIQCILTFN